MLNSDNLMSAINTKSVFTIATGKVTYFNMAINLARSFEWHNSTSDLLFYIVTDLNLSLPPDLKRTQLIPVRDGIMPKGFSSKLHLDRLAVTEEALFIDADCLVMGPLEELFAEFGDKPVGVLGVSVVEGEWFGDIKSHMVRLGVDKFMKFNGGVYYLNKAKGAVEIYNAARNIETRYDEIGFLRLRGQPNDELSMAAALSKFDVLPVNSDGRFYGDFQWWPILLNLDVLSGQCRMRNPPPPDPQHQSAFPALDANPLILHFLGHHINSPEYVEQAFALRFRYWPLSNFLARFLSTPSYLERKLKNFGRPFFRKIFGVRAVQAEKTRYIVNREV